MPKCHPIEPARATLPGASHGLGLGCLLLIAIALGACSSESSDAAVVGPEPEDDAGDATTNPRPGPDGSAGDDAATPANDAGARCAISTIMDGFVPTRVLHVAADGDDSRDGLTRATAWRSLANSSRLLPGDQVDVEPGTYACGARINVRATAERPVRIRSADPANPAVFDCAGSAGIAIDSAAYVALDGLEVRNAGGHALHISSGAAPFTELANHILVTRCHLHDATLACIKGNQAEDVDFIANELDRPESAGSSPSGQALDLVAVARARIVANRVHDVPTNVAIQAKGGAIDTLIDGNVIWDVGTAIHMGGATGPEFFLPRDADYEGLRVVAVNNVIYGAVGVAMSAIGCRDCLMANNTVASTATRQPVRGLPGATATGATSHTSGLRLVNNLFYFSGARPMDVLNFTPDDQAGFVQSHNLWFYADGPVGDLYSDVPIGGPGIVADSDPRLSAPVTGDLRPGAGSPALGAGTPEAGVLRDATGACRATWNIGAH